MSAKNIFTGFSRVFPKGIHRKNQIPAPQIPSVFSGSSRFSARMDAPPRVRFRAPSFSNIIQSKTRKISVSTMYFVLFS